jgi:hypothetical protein
VIALVTMLICAEPVQKDELATALDAVYADGAFGKEETKIVWRAIPDEEEEKPTKVEMPRGPFGLIVAIVVATAGVALLGMLLLTMWRQRQRAEAEAAAPGAAALPVTLFGLDVRPESLPNDITAAATWCWSRGDYQGALSLLYRGALALVVRRGTEVPASATEGECVTRVATKLGTSLGGDFALLTDAWQRTAYGNHPPRDEAFHELVGRWRPHFGAPT